MTVQRTIFWLRLLTLLGLCLPAAELAWRWAFAGLGPRPVTVATHVTGDWAVVFLLLSLALTPARAVLDWAPLVHIRRRVGIAAALYALVHLVIYAFDHKWDIVVVAAEIIARFYLAIGFAALLLLSALAATSTNGWQKRLRRNWKRLHLLVYPIAAVAILHFFLQSKVNAGQPVLAAGLFAWLMIWRVLPPQLRTRYLGLVLLTIGAMTATIAFEVAWYALVHNIEHGHILAADLDLELAPRPVHVVMLASLAVIVLVAIRRWIPNVAKMAASRHGRPAIATT